MIDVSVIMGVYNCKNLNLLEKSVQSIINQTYKNWELLLCDDGSSDDTYEILKQIEKRDSRIKVLHYEKNQGLAFALNCCINEARGKYIARQDDDDVSKSNRFERQLKILEEHPEYAIVGCIAEVFDENGIWGEYKVAEMPQKKDFYWNSPFMHPTVMVRREAYEAIDGYRVARETSRCEDIDLFMRMYAKGYRGYNLQEKLYYYRMTNNPKKKYRSMRDRFHETIVKWQGYGKMNILFPFGILYVLKPLAVGMVPQFILYRIKKIQY